ncbi:ExbD/TolR family protein [Acetonema longum]|uniref:Biopolymer transport protein n=1 Tax=Acetonema longum DSM 6540 TaxID=1009370 RepID=F7NM66_9FIRM|nr:biopolymer transporter ExbD [Acetonema longum]EGO62867.1 Biopolymer transport protein [Acetonema longum DSM 6540]
MRLPRQAPRKARIEIIPMIDTMFFLLVFFMLSSLSMIQQYTVPVNLPQAVGSPEKIPAVVTLTITEDGKMFCDKEPVQSPREAVMRLRQQSQGQDSLAVVINADQNVKHGQVVELLDAIQQSGLEKIAVAINHVKAKG